MTAKRILSAALSSAFALTTLAAPAAVLAQASDTSIVNSGDHAEIRTDTERSTSVHVFNENVANISQKVNSVSNTGDNSANGNIGGGLTIRTGNAATGVTMQAQANQNTTGISGVGGNSGINVLDVVNTGDHADVNSALNSDTHVGVHNSNKAVVNQALNSYSNTGGNSADENIARYGGGVDINTGNATTQAGFGVNVNKNQTGITLGNMNSALGSDTVITNTGDKADVDTSTNSNTKLSVYNHNVAYLNQLMNVKSNTGYNSSDENIGGTDIWTGNASAVGQFLANANSNMTGIGGQQGGSSLNLADVVNTGDYMDSTSRTNSRVHASVSNYNALTDYSVFSQKSNTGHNYSDENIGSGPTLTGGAGAAGSMSAGGNHNTTVLGSASDVLALWLLGSL